MKAKSLFYLIFVCTFAFTSCDKIGRIAKIGNALTAEKVYTSDIDIRTVNGVRYAYYNGSVYSGDVYSNNQKHKMVIKNGLAIRAYANYGVHSGNHKEMTIEEDIYSLQRRQEIAYSNTPGTKFASDLFDTPKIEALKLLPNCSFSY